MASSTTQQYLAVPDAAHDASASMADGTVSVRSASSDYSNYLDPDGGRPSCDPVVRAPYRLSNLDKYSYSCSYLSASPSPLPGHREDHHHHYDDHYPRRSHSDDASSIAAASSDGSEDYDGPALHRCPRAAAAAAGCAAGTIGLPYSATDGGVSVDELAGRLSAVQRQQQRRRRGSAGVVWLRRACRTVVRRVSLPLPSVSLPSVPSLPSPTKTSSGRSGSWGVLPLPGRGWGRSNTAPVPTMTAGVKAPRWQKRGTTGSSEKVQEGPEPEAEEVLVGRNSVRHDSVMFDGVGNEYGKLCNGQATTATRD